MRRRHTITEQRMTEWAVVRDEIRRGLPLHDPSRPSESIEYRIMTGQTAKASKGAIKSDGGMYQSLRRHRHHIAIAQRTDEIDRIIARMRRTKPDHHRVLMQAFLDRPGYICDTRIGADEQNVSQNKYLKIYGEAMMFIEGALDKPFALNRYKEVDCARLSDA